MCVAQRTVHGERISGAFPLSLCVCHLEKFLEDGRSSTSSSEVLALQTCIPAFKFLKIVFERINIYFGVLRIMPEILVLGGIKTRIVSLKSAWAMQRDLVSKIKSI